MAINKKRVETDLDKLVEDAEPTQTSPVDDYLDKLLEQVEARREDDEPASANSTQANNAGADGEKTAKPQTVDELLDQIDAKSKADVDRAIQDDNRKITQKVNPAILAKTRKSTKKYAGYLAFCVIVLIVGIVWTAIGIATGSKWPVPIFGLWNIGCGVFLIIWSVILFLDQR